MQGKRTHLSFVSHLINFFSFKLESQTLLCCQTFSGLAELSPDCLAMFKIRRMCHFKGMVNCQNSRAKDPPKCKCMTLSVTSYPQTFVVFAKYSRLYRHPVNTKHLHDFIQCWTNVEDVGPTLYKCYTNVLCLRRRRWPNIKTALGECLVRVVSGLVISLLNQPHCTVCWRLTRMPV